jgi:hypothetical protein
MTKFTADLLEFIVITILLLSLLRIICMFVMGCIEHERLNNLHYKRGLDAVRSLEEKNREGTATALERNVRNATKKVCDICSSSMPAIIIEGDRNYAEASFSLLSSRTIIILGGYVRGFSECQLMGVIAHEIAHRRLNILSHLTQYMGFQRMEFLELAADRAAVKWVGLGIMIDSFEEIVRKEISLGHAADPDFRKRLERLYLLAGKDSRDTILSEYE